MKKLTLAFTLLLTATAAAHAQLPNGSPGSDPLREEMRTGDAARVGEAHIRASRLYGARAENQAAARRGTTRTFKAEIVVTNSAAKAIKYVNWTATLTDPATGNVIQTYDVTTKANIAPGRKKKLAKRLQTPSAAVLSASAHNRARPPVADLKVAVTGVTYADGSTSAKP